MRLPPPLIALVDDDLPFLTETAARIQNLGFRAAIWFRPRLAFRFLRRALPDAVLLDLDMPYESGYQVLDKLRSCSLTARIPVLLLTWRDEQDARIEGFERGLDDFLAKPFHSAELRLRLEAVLRRHRESAAAQSGLGFAQLDPARKLHGRVFALRRAPGSAADARLFSNLAHRMRDRLARVAPGGLAAVEAGALGEDWIFFAPRDLPPAAEPLLREVFARDLALADRLATRPGADGFLRPASPAGFRAFEARLSGAMLGTAIRSVLEEWPARTRFSTADL
jgi:DNA-binding response OmpR family regulator